LNPDFSDDHQADERAEQALAEAIEPFPAPVNAGRETRSGHERWVLLDRCSAASATA